MRKVILAIIAILVIVVAVLLVRGCSDDSGAYEVRAVFDNGGFVVPGEDVRVAGANVGSVKSIDVSMPGENVSSDPSTQVQPGKAIVVMKIKDKGFQDFRSDASCIIRPQSLIGEKFIDCSVTDPRPPGTEAPPELEVIPDGEPGAGQRLLPLENNGKAVDQDLITNMYRLPYAQRLRVVLNELGAGLATRGPELRETITRANPTLMQVNKVLKILADHSDQLSELAKNGDNNLTKLAAKRKNMVGFFKSAGYTAAATAERSDAQRENLRNLPKTLRELRSTFAALGTFAGDAKPVFDELRPHVKDISEVTTKLKPFAEATEVSLTSLGEAARTAGPDLVASRPIIQKLGRQARVGKEPSTDLNFFLGSTRGNDGFRNLMKLFYGTGSVLNGYDQFGHYQRTNVLVSSCTQYAMAKNETSCSTQWADERAQNLTGASLSAALPELDAPSGDPEGSIDPDYGTTGDTGDTADGGAQGSGDESDLPGVPGIEGLSGPTGETGDGSSAQPEDQSGADGKKVGATGASSQLRSRMSILDYLLGE